MPKSSSFDTFVILLNTSTRILNDEELAFLRRNYFSLVDLIKPTDVFINQLSKERCITARQKEAILRHRDDSERNKELLAILKRRSFAHFGFFKNVLEKTKQRKLLKIFNNLETTLVRVHCENQSQSSDIREDEIRICDHMNGTQQLSRDKQLEERILMQPLIDGNVELIGAAPTGSIYVYFLCATYDSLIFLKNNCDSGELERILESVFNCILDDVSIQMETNVSLDEASYRRNIKEVQKTNFSSALEPSLECERHSVQMNKEGVQFKHSQIQQTTNDSMRKQILHHYTEIKNNLDPRYDILDQLYEEGILRHETHKYISSFSSSDECCSKLLDHLLNKEDIEKSLVGFKEAIRMNHSWIYNMIWMDPSDVSNTNDRPLSENERRRIIYNTPFLIKLIDPHKSDFLSYLAETRCITVSHFVELGSLVDKQEMVSKLLKILLRRSFAHFQLFIHCLKSTRQLNTVHILESNGVVMNMHLKFDNPDLDVEDEELVEDIMQSFEERELLIVRGAFGRLIVYKICMSLDAVNEMENLYRTKELETSLNTVVNVVIKIDDCEFTRCRWYFSKRCSRNIDKWLNFIDHRTLHCKMLNEMPLEILDMILKRTSWMMWICFLIKSLQFYSSMPLTGYLKNGARGFSNFVKVSSTYIHRELSTVCRVWRNLLKDENNGSSFNSELLSKISRIAIKRSEKILIESLQVQESLLDLSLDEGLITTHGKFCCESMAEKSIEMFIGFIYRDKNRSFTKLLKFLILLEKQCGSHLVNYIISFGVHWPNFEKQWPLDKKTKLLINAAHDSHDIICIMNTDKNIANLEKKLDQTDDRDDIEKASYNLVSLLFKNNCITADQRNELDKSKDPEKNKKLMKLLENGSIEMFEIVIDYLQDTDQNSVVDLLQPNRELQKYRKNIVNCFTGATEILNMIEKKKITSLHQDEFSINSHRAHFGRLNGFQKNEIVLNILECSKSDLYIIFLNFLLTSKQHDLMLFMFQSCPLARLMVKFESHLLDSIDVDTNLLLILVKFKIIDQNQMREIESKKTPIERNKHFLEVVSKMTGTTFDLFLMALDASGRSCVLENLPLMYPEPDKPSCVSSLAVYRVEAESIQEAQSIEMSSLFETPSDTEDRLPDRRWRDSAEFWKLIKYEEEIEYTLEKKNNFCLSVNKKIQPFSSVTSELIENITLLPEDIQNMLFLKRVAICKQPSENVPCISLYFYSILGYISNRLDDIFEQEIPGSIYSDWDSVSLGINPAEVARKKEIKLQVVVEKMYETLITSLDPSGNILQTLVENGVLTLKQMREIEAMPTPKCRAEELFLILSATKHVQAFSFSVNSLKHNYAMLVEIINEVHKTYTERSTLAEHKANTECREGSNKLIMTKAEDNYEDFLRQCVREMYPKIVASFDPKGYVLDSLFAEGTITNDEKQRIERLPERRSAALVDMLYSSRKPNAIAQFLEILSNDEMTCCKWISDEIRTAVKVKVGSTLTPSLGNERSLYPLVTVTDDEYEDILRQYLKERYSTIIARFDSKGYILDSLFAKGLISIQEKQQLERLPVGRSAELVSLLLDSQRSNAISQFLESLTISNEPVWQWISDDVLEVAKEKLAATLTPLKRERRSVSMMTQADDNDEDFLRQCVTKNYARIFASFDPREYILDRLIMEGAITIREKHQIETLSDGRGTALVNLLLAGQRPNAIAKFLEILSIEDKTVDNWIHDEVRKADYEKRTVRSPLESRSISVEKSQVRDILLPEQTGKEDMLPYITTTVAPKKQWPIENRDFKMQDMLGKKLNEHRERQVTTLNVSPEFTATLGSSEVKSDKHKQPFSSNYASIVTCSLCFASIDQKKGCSECGAVPFYFNDPEQHGMSDAENTDKQGRSGINLERNFMETLEIMDMETRFPKKLAWMNVASVKPVSFSRGIDVIGKLLKMDHRAITACDISRRMPIHSEGGKTRGSESIETDAEREEARGSDEFDEDVVHPMDVLSTIYNCCDKILLQIMTEKLFHCRLSIPLLFHDFEVDKSKFLLWSLRNIFLQVRIAEGRKEEFSIVDAPQTIVSFLRSSGKLPLSKSQILNILLNNTPGHPTFFHRNCQNGTTERLISNGTIEAAWHLESGSEIRPFNRTFAVLNLRGDATEFPCQAQWMCENSSLVFIMMKLRKHKQLEIPEILLKICKDPRIHLFVYLITDKYKTVDKKKKDIDELEEINKCNNFKFLCNWCKTRKKIYNEEEIKFQIQSEINKFMYNKDANIDLKTLTMLAESVMKYGFCLDENHKHADDAFCRAATLIGLIEKISPERRKAELLPLQGSFWKELGELKKEQNQCKLTENVQAQITAFKVKEANIRKQQYTYLQHRSAFCERLFLMIQEDLASTKNLYIIQWINILLKKLNMETVHDYWEVQLTDRSIELESSSKEQKAQYSSKSLQKMIEMQENLPVQLVDIFREFGQMYEATEFCHWELYQAATDHQTIKDLPNAFANIILQGIPFELMDGERAIVPITWVTAVFQAVKRLVGDKRLIVISVVGLQSSGKSTLLNLMFGLNFPVNAGRCTKGLYCVMIPVEHVSGCSEYDFILVIDTEGLRATESDGGHIHDNELATMVFGLADATVVNIKGENLGECKGILEIVVHALIRIRCAKPGILKPSCVFVHQNVPAADAIEKLNDSILLSALDKITAVTAAEEGENYIKQFKDIINYNSEYFSLYMPDLWLGQPPMAQINFHYCDKARDLTKQLIEFSKPTSITLSKFTTRIYDLWEAIQKENFVFHFRNHAEINAFHYLDKIFTDKCHVLNELCLDLQNHCQCRLRIMTESISLRNMNTELYDKIEKDLGSKHTELQELFQKEIATSDHKDILAQWQESYCLKLEHFCDTKRDQAITMLNVLHEKTERKIQNSEHLPLKAKFEELTIQTARQLRALQSGLDEAELREYFDGEWFSWIRRYCSPYDEASSKFKILKAFNMELERLFRKQSTLFHDQLRNEPLDEYKGYYFDDFTPEINTHDLNIEFSLNPLKLLKDSWNPSQMQPEIMAACRCFEASSTISEYVKGCHGSDFYPEQASCTIMKIYDFFEESKVKKSELGFTFRHEFRIKFTIQLCKCAINQFLVNKSYFERINNPFAGIIDAKSDFCDAFILAYH